MATPSSSFRTVAGLLLVSFAFVFSSESPTDSGFLTSTTRHSAGSGFGRRPNHSDY